MCDFWISLLERVWRRDFGLRSGGFPMFLCVWLWPGLWILDLRTLYLSVGLSSHFVFLSLPHSHPVLCLERQCSYIVSYISSTHLLSSLLAELCHHLHSSAHPCSPAYLRHLLDSPKTLKPHLNFTTFPSVLSSLPSTLLTCWSPTPGLLTCAAVLHRQARFHCLSPHPLLAQ